MDAERLTEIRERWEDRYTEVYVDDSDGPDGDWSLVDGVTEYAIAYFDDHGTAESFAAAPADIADLLAEVERLRADAKHLRRPARRVVAAFDMFNAAPASPDTVWNLVSEQVEQLRAAIAADALAGGDA